MQIQGFIKLTEVLQMDNLARNLEQEVYSFYNNLIDEALGYDEEKYKEKFTVDNDSKADWCLSKISALDMELERFTSTIQEKINFLKSKIEELDDKIKQKRECISNEKSFFEGLLLDYFVNRVDQKFKKELKTMWKYKLPSGELQLKKPSMSLKYDKEKLLEYVILNGYDEYVRIKQEVDWGNFKKQLDINRDGNIINISTGEIIETEGLTIDIVEGKFEVKI